MSLDIAILAPDGAVLKEVNIGMEAHKDLIRAATRLALPLIGRLHDYYNDDVVYAVSELDAFEAEIRTIRQEPDLDSEILGALLLLVEDARKLSATLVTLAD